MINVTEREIQAMKDMGFIQTEHPIKMWFKQLWFDIRYHFFWDTGEDNITMFRKWGRRDK
jgi:hypothetical protein